MSYQHILQGMYPDQKTSLLAANSEVSQDTLNSFFYLAYFTGYSS